MLEGQHSKSRVPLPICHVHTASYRRTLLTSVLLPLSPEKTCLIRTSPLFPRPAFHAPLTPPAQRPHTHNRDTPTRSNSGTPWIPTTTIVQTPTPRPRLAGVGLRRPSLSSPKVEMSTTPARKTCPGACVLPGRLTAAVFRRSQDVFTAFLFG